MEEKKKKTYRNFTRSEKAIIRAYVELMQKKGRSRITVTDIVNTADLNRSTFYAHFKSADDVREKIQSDIINELTSSLNKRDFRNALSDPYPAMMHVIAFIRKDAEMYKMLLNTEGANKFLKKLRNIVIEKCLSDEVILPYIKDRDEFEMNLRMFIGGYVSVIEDWAAGNINMPVEKTAKIMSDSVKLCVHRYLSN
ncbi:MAG: TetR/AcrR family transcriptional regulator [Clostridia bacterium]|nr:TetR/AcrR family transcriptional regulator [Clostridia bacterium]